GPVRVGDGADWERWARLARRFELRRLEGHVRSVCARRSAATDEAYAAYVARAREAFERGFGAAGRARCRVIHVAHRAFDALRSLSPASRLFFPLAPDGPLPPAEAPPAAPGQPICPLSDRPPYRLLFSTRDTVGGARGV